MPIFAITDTPPAKCQQSLWPLGFALFSVVRTPKVPLMEWLPQPAGVASMPAVLLRCADLIGVYDLDGCRKHALTAHHSDPHQPGPVQALAIVDVLFAAEKRLGRGHRDWYSILQVQATSRPEAVLSQFTKLVHLLNPAKNKFPFARESLMLVMRAWRVLSDPTAKARYDEEVAAPATFHTVCPYCYYIFEYGIVYEDHCLRCQTCRRPFHAAAISTPLPEIVTVVGADGRVAEGYHCRLARFPLQYQLNPDIVEVEKSGDADAPVMEISSEEEVGRGRGGIGTSNGSEGAAKVEVSRDEQTPRKRRVKTAAGKSTRRMTGRVATNLVPVPQPQTNNDNDTNHGMVSDVITKGIGSDVKDADNLGLDDFQFIFEGDDIFVEIP